MTDSSESEGKKRLFGTLVILFVLALVFVYFTIGRYFLGFDAYLLFAPYYSLLSDYTWSGKLLLWNPWSNCGSPDTAYVEMGSFSPLTIAHSFITSGSADGFLLYWLTIWAIAGIGMYRLGNHLKAPLSYVLAITLSFMFSGFFLGNASHTSWLYAFSFLPLMVWRMDVCLLTGRKWPAIEAGALHGLSALAGHPSLVITNGLFLGLWIVGRTMTLASEQVNSTEAPYRSRVCARLPNAVVGLALFLVCSSLVLLPAYASFFYDGAGFSDRAGELERSYAISNHALPIKALATMASPYIPVLGIDNPNLWKGTWPFLVGTYAGCVIPAFAILAVMLRPKKGSSWWLFGCGLLFIGFAMGSELPLRGWLYDLCPPTRYFRHTSFMRAYFLFSMAVLALVGSKELAETASQTKAWRLFFVSALATSLLAWAGYVLIVGSVSNLSEHVGIATIHLVFVWSCVPVLAALAWKGSERFRESIVPPLIIVVVLIDCACSFWLSGPLMYADGDTVRTLAAQRVRSLHLDTADLTRDRQEWGISFGHNFNFYEKNPLMESYNQLSNRFHSPRSLTPLPTNWYKEKVLWKTACDSNDRILFSKAAVLADLSDACFMAFVERARELGAVPMVVHKPDDVVHMKRRGEPGQDDAGQSALIKQLPAATPVRRTVLAYTTTHMVVDVECPDNGWLLFCDRWARGWSARVDGEPVPLYGGGFIFRAVHVTKGTHRIEFSYRPGGYPWLLILSWGCLFSVLAVSVVVLPWRRSLTSHVT